ARGRARPRSGAARRGDLPGVEVPFGRRVVVRCDRPDAAHAVDRARHRDPDRRQRVSHRRPVQPGDQYPLRGLVPRQPLQEIGEREARARRLQRRPGQRRPVACAGRGDPVPRDSRVREAGRAPRVDLPPRLALAALLVVCGGRGAVTRRMTELLELAENANTYTPLGPTDERDVNDGYVLWMGRGDEPGWNVAQRFRLRADEVDDVRAEIHARLRAKGRTACTWEVGTHATPSDLVDRLLARGLVDDSTPLAVGMVLTDAPAAVRPDVEVRRATTPEERLAAARIAAIRLG